jgi:hypothetical protein
MTVPQKVAAGRPGTGLWYLLLAGLSFGFLACVPFWHAPQRLQRADVRRWAIAFTAVTVYLVVLMVLTPQQDADGTSGNSTISTINTTR